MVQRRGLLWLMMLALLAAQTLGLMHRVVHGEAGSPHSTFASHHAHDKHAPHAGDGLGDLFSSHDDSGCRVYDQLGQCGMLPGVPAVPLPSPVPGFFILWFQGEYLARWAALFDARGPPVLR